MQRSRTNQDSETAQRRVLALGTRPPPHVAPCVRKDHDTPRPDRQTEAPPDDDRAPTLSGRTTQCGSKKGQGTRSPDPLQALPGRSVSWRCDAPSWAPCGVRWRDAPRCCDAPCGAPWRGAPDYGASACVATSSPRRVSRRRQRPAEGVRALPGGVCAWWTQWCSREGRRCGGRLIVGARKSP